MGRLELLNSTLHRSLRVDQSKTEAPSAGLRSIPVVLSEFLKLAVQYPIVITKNSETGQFVCVAVFGFEQGENLFWKNNQWDGLYVPLNVARQPFFAGEDNVDQTERKQNVICIDRESASVQEVEGEALFDDNGNETPYLNKVKSILAELLDGERKTKQFLQTMVELELLTPVSLDITFANNETQRVDGMYTIDERKLDSLSHEKLGKLQVLGYLSPIYAMVVSLGQIYALIQRKNKVLSAGSQWFKQESE